MSRLERKCLAGSIAAHGLLLLVLFLGAAFLDRPPKPLDFPLLDVIPTKVVDAALFGGGEPKVQPPPPAAVQTPTPVPVKPEPAKPEPKPLPEPRPQPRPTPPVKPPQVKPAEPKPAPEKEKPKIQVSTKTTRLSQPKPRPAETGIQPKVADELRSRIAATANRLNRELTPITTISVPGKGGEAFANYKQVVISIYRGAWIRPMGIEQTVIVKATVIIARDGRVVSSRITRLSGNREVDDSVEDVLRRVKKVGPFPEGATDDTRTFDLSFELTPADLSG